MLRELTDITMDLSRILGRLALDRAADGDAKAAGDDPPDAEAMTGTGPPLAAE
jgi:hypothetical protein